MYSLNDAMIATLIAFLASVVVCPFAIPFLRRAKFGQNVRDDGPKTHLKKTGTPTMGGIAILISFTLSSVFYISGNQEGLVIVLTTLAFGLVGFLDDYVKVVKKRSLGLRAYQKLVLQFIVASVFVWYLVLNDELMMYSILYLPFTDAVWDTGILFIPLMLVGIVGIVNAVNLTDGLDGLATGVTACICVFFMITAWGVSSASLPIVGAATGSLLGFLLFNTHPAKVFMGDTGSLALGGLVVSVAIILRMPIFLAIVGLVYVVEAASVVIQVFYFKKTKKRFFKMAPIHHHFELSGMEETRVVMMFFIVTAILCLIGFIAS